MESLSMLDKAILSEYENILLNKKKGFSNCYFNGDETANQQTALCVIKFAFETYLRWEPEMIRDCLTFDILKKLKLVPLLKYIICPPEINIKKDVYYLAWLLYPKTIHISQRELTLLTYKKVLNKELPKFPKEFFSGSKGYFRLSLCLQYYLSENCQYSSITDIYNDFAVAPKVNKILRNAHLLSITKDMYKNPIDLLHNTLPISQKNCMVYNYYKFYALLETENIDVNIDNKLENDN